MLGWPSGDGNAARAAHAADPLAPRETSPMPFIACSSCKARFKVKVDTIGKAIRCPKCQQEFRAVALHSAPRSKTDHGPIVYAGIGVGAILIGFLVVSMAKTSSTLDDEPAAAAEVAPEKRLERSPTKAAADDDAMSPEDLLARRARQLLEALRDPADPRLPGWVAYGEMHEDRMKEGLETVAWSDLAQDEQYGKYDAYLNLVAGDDATRRFAKATTVESTEVLRLGSGKGKVAARLKNNLDETIQDVVLHFVGTGGQWKLAKIEREPITTVEAIAEAADDRGGRSGATALDRIGRRRNPLGEVSAVEPYADEPKSVGSDIARQIQMLSDLSATVEAGRARARLVEIGKHSVPHLLNALVPLDFEDEADLQVATRIAQALTDLTGASHPIVPGMNTGSLLGEGATDNEANRRKWFGWWRDNKNSYTGPPAPTFGEEDG